MPRGTRGTPCSRRFRQRLRRACVLSGQAGRPGTDSVSGPMRSLWCPGIGEGSGAADRGDPGGEGTWAAQSPVVATYYEMCTTCFLPPLYRAPHREASSPPLRWTRRWKRMWAMLKTVATPAPRCCACKNGTCLGGHAGAPPSPPMAAALGLQAQPHPVQAVFGARPVRTSRPEQSDVSPHLNRRRGLGNLGPGEDCPTEGQFLAAACLARCSGLRSGTRAVLRSAV